MDDQGYYEYQYEEYDNTTDEYCEVTPTNGLLASILTATFSLWLVLCNSFILVSVCYSKLERQRKQMISLNTSSLLLGMVALPILHIQFHGLPIFRAERMCCSFLGITHLTLLIQLFGIGVILCTTFTYLRFPFHAQKVSEAESKILIFQWILPTVYMSGVITVCQTQEDSVLDCCNWLLLPYWYFYSVFLPVFCAATISFVFVLGILWVAKQQARSLEAQEMSVTSVHPERVRARFNRQSRFIRASVIAFILTWIPAVIVLGLSLGVPDLLSHTGFYLVYISLLTAGASTPALVTVIFGDIRSQIMIFLRRGKVSVNN